MLRTNETTGGLRQTILVPQSDNKTQIKSGFARNLSVFIAVCVILLVSGSVALQNSSFLDLFTSPAVEQAGPHPLVPHPPSFAYLKRAHQENTALVSDRSSRRVVSALPDKSVWEISRQFGGPAEITFETSYSGQKFLQEIEGVAVTQPSSSDDAPPDLTGNGIAGAISVVIDQSDLSFLNTGLDNTTDLTSSRATLVRFPGQP